MHQPGDLHPLGLAVPPDGLGCLEEVLDLRDASLSSLGREQRLRRHGEGMTHIRVGVVDELVEHLHRFPDAWGRRYRQSLRSCDRRRRHTHSCADGLLELLANLDVVFNRLLLCDRSDASGSTNGKLRYAHPPCCSR